MDECSVIVNIGWLQYFYCPNCRTKSPYFSIANLANVQQRAPLERRAHDTSNTWRSNRNEAGKQAGLSGVMERNPQVAVRERNRQGRPADDSYNCNGPARNSLSRSPAVNQQ